MRLLISKDFVAGLVFITIGLVALIVGQTYRIGTASQMGPGYFPVMLAVGMLGIGLILALKAWREADPEPVEGGRWQAVFFPTLAVVVFGLVLSRLGLVLSLVLLLGIAALGSDQTRWKEVPLLIAASVVFSVAVFVWGVNLQVPVWPR